jgi:hypothetical protein
MYATNRDVRIYRLTPAAIKRLEDKASRFEWLLQEITRVSAPGES